MQRVTDFSDRFRFRRIVAITRASYQPVARANSEHDFREVRRKRDHAINFGRQTYTPSGIIRNITCCTRVRSSSRSAARNQRETDSNGYTNNSQTVIAMRTHRPPILNHLCFLRLFVADTFFA